MALTSQDVSRIAQLARLELRDDEQAAMLTQLNEFFDIVEKMRAVDTSGVEPLYTPLSAIPRLPYGAIASCPGLDVAQVMADVVQECQAVAQARGAALPADILASTLALAQAMPQQFSSTAQDLARGKRSEIDHLNGFIVRQGAALGIATPVNRLLHTLVRLLEQHLPGTASSIA